MRQRLPHTPARCCLLLLLLALCSSSALADVFGPSLPPTVHPTELGARLLHPRSVLPAATIVTEFGWLINGSLFSAMIAKQYTIEPEVVQAAANDDTAAILFLPAGLGSIPAPMAFLVHDVVEVALITDRARAVALRHTNGSVLLIEEGNLDLLRYLGRWLPGSYTALSAGTNTICFLNTTGYAHCVNGLSSWPDDSMTLKERAHIQYKQISCGDTFTCGLRANDSHVECFGMIDYETPANLYSSALAYSSIAAHWSRGFCGIVVDDGSLSCWTRIWRDAHEWREAVVIPAPAAAVFLRAPVVSAVQTIYGAALLSNGSLLAEGLLHFFTSDVVTPVGQLTIGMQHILYDNAATARLRLRGIAEGAVALDQWLFVPPRLVVVDPLLGDDALCAGSDMLPSSMASLTPCRSVARAVELISAPKGWVLLLPGEHTGGDVLVAFSDVTVSSQLPEALSAEAAAVALNGTLLTRLAEGVALWNCTGFANCLRGTSDELTVSGLSFTGSTEHALWHSADPEPLVAVSRNKVTLRDCVFTRLGGMLRKIGGEAVVSGCSMTDAVHNPLLVGLLELTDSDLTLTSSVFSDNHFLTPQPPGEDLFEQWQMFSCVSLRTDEDAVEAMTRKLRITVSGSTFARNSAVHSFSYIEGEEQVGGVALSLLLGQHVVLIENTQFIDQQLRCSGCMGGAIAVMLTIRVEIDSEINVESCTFERCAVNKYEEFDIFETNGGGGALAVLESRRDTSGVYSAPSLFVVDCTFTGCSAATSGGAVLASTLQQLRLRRSIFRDCEANMGGAVALLNLITQHFLPSSFLVGSSTFVNNIARGGRSQPRKQRSDSDTNSNSGRRAQWRDHCGRAGVPFHALVSRWLTSVALMCLRVLVTGSNGGAIWLDSVTAEVSINYCELTNSVAEGMGGAIAIMATLTNPHVSITGVTINNATAEVRGGAIFAHGGSLTIYSSQSFNTAANIAGGFLSGVGTKVRMVDVHIFDSHLLPHPRTGIINRGGGAISVSSGKLYIEDSSFTRCSALSLDGTLEGCEATYKPASALCSQGTGGAVSAELVDLTVMTTRFEDVRACSGGAISIRSGYAEIGASKVWSAQAYSGGAFAAVAMFDVLEMRNNAIVNVTAVAAGGAIVLSDCQMLILYGVRFQNCSCTKGDGGALWTTAMANDAELTIESCRFIDVAAPAGAGAVIFSLTKPGTRHDTLIVTGNDKNEVELERLQPPVSLYGPVQATDLASLSASAPSLRVYPGQDFASEQAPVSLSIFALDAYNQTMQADRALVVQVQAQHSAANDDDMGPPPPLPQLSGTVLQGVHGGTGAAAFNDLRIASIPGEYLLKFTLNGQSGIFTFVTLTVDADCPGGLYYDSTSRSCKTCDLDFLVYNVTAQTCLPCPAGQQVTRVAVANNSAADGGGQSAAGSVSCQLCPLGSMSAAGGECASCGLNAYQPTPAAACQPCGGVAGLQCAGSGLAAVQSGFFAFSVWDRRENGPRIQTHPCPDGFCAGGFVQGQRAEEGGNATNSAALRLRSDPTGPSAAVPFPSAISRFDKCAHPRLAAEHNILCGECVAGHIPWGSKCVRCDQSDGGMLALLLFLSFLLVAFLLRSAVGSSSAGHSVIVLYFVQTAMLEVGGASKLLGWLNIALFSPNSTGECVAPLSPYQQTQVQIVMPLFLFAELMAVGGLHYLAFRRWAAVAQAEGRSAAAKGASLIARLRSSALRFIGAFSSDLYISASLSLLLFSYTQVAAACLSYLACVDVGGVSVIFSQPAMRCESDDYQRTLVLVVIALAVYVAGFPLAVLIFLLWRSDLVRESHGLIVARAKAKAAAAPEGAAGVEDGVDVGSVADLDIHRTGSVVSSSPSTAAAAHFLRRYSPLFSMYSPSAWFWQVFVLARRTVFVAVSVTLVRSGGDRNLAFSLAHLASLLVQLHFRPFQSAFFNGAEVAAHVLLIVLSMTLSVKLPPLARGTEVFLFLLIVPPLGVYSVAAAFRQYFTMRSNRAQRFAERLAAQQQAEETQWAAAAPADRDVQVELHDLSVSVPASAPARFSAAVRSPPIGSPSADAVGAASGGAASSSWAAEQRSIDEDFSVAADDSSSSHAL